MQDKLLLVVIDGVPYRNFRRLFGNLEGWVDSGEASVFKIRAPLPSTSLPSYATIHSGVVSALHGVTGNNTEFRVDQPDIFSELRKRDKVTGAVAHSSWSAFFNRAPFDDIRDIEYNEPQSDSINYGRFHTMHGYSGHNLATPADRDLFWTLSMLIEKYQINYGLFHTCTLDSLGHKVGHDCRAMDDACFFMDQTLAPFIRQWRAKGYELLITADHGQSERGHHGGRGEDQQDTALYYFGQANTVDSNTILCLTSLAPSILHRFSVPIPGSMKTKSIFCE